MSIVNCAAGLRDTLDPDALAELYHQAHERSYNFRDVDSHVEARTIRLRVVGEVPQIAMPRAAAGKAASARGTRRFYWNGADHAARVYLRNELEADAVLEGPAIIEQEDTTIVILDGWRGSVDDAGNLIIERGSP